ncbi:MAG: Gfo/Idh/MocA family oxidoreductase [Akkermansiaceae bacterium]|nr:Gfo/Idh/MocA family oxidoreductase [Akkermansiaceae bacterium]
MNFGIIGTGMIARIHASAISAIAGSRLHSVCNHRLAGAANLAADYQIPAFDDLQRFLSDPSLDIVTICTPSGAHFEPALAALAAGKHVICEKPLEVTTARVDRMIAAAEASGKTLASVLNRRFTPAMAAFKQAVDACRFGRLTSASCYVKWFRDQAYYDSAPWRGTWALDGGGVLMNQAIHAIDALLLLAGPAVSVQALTACLAHRDIEVEDHGMALVGFANGACGVIEGSTCAWSATGHPARVQLAGTEGSVFMADESFEVWDFKTGIPEDAGIRASLLQGAATGLGANHPSAIGHLQHQRNFEEIIAAIRDGREPETAAREARKAIALIEAIYESARHGGRTVELPW